MDFTFNLLGMNIWVVLVVVFSSLLKGLTGFGFALVSLPVLMAWYPPREIIPVLMICNLIASLFIVLQKKQHPLVTRPYQSLIVSGGLFTVLGVMALKTVSEQTLVHITGLAFIVLTLFSWRKLPEVKLPPIAFSLAGALIGFITGAISVSGPPLALFLNLSRVDNRGFREIFAWFSIVTAVVAIAGYIQTGLLTMQSLKMALVFVPILLFGTIVGKRLNSLFSVNAFRKINMAITLLASFLLLVS